MTGPARAAHERRHGGRAAALQKYRGFRDMDNAMPADASRSLPTLASRVLGDLGRVFARLPTLGETAESMRKRHTNLE
jgi:hypothetical protein